MTDPWRRWRRLGKKSGPANVLDERWEVVGAGSSWFVVDLTRSGGLTDRIVGPSHGTMRSARRAAEALAGRPA